MRRDKVEMETRGATYDYAMFHVPYDIEHEAPDNVLWVRNR